MFGFGRAPGDIPIGGASVEIGVDNSKVRPGLRRTKEEFRRFGSDLTAVGLRLAAVGGGFLAFFGTTVSAASQLEEVKNKFDSVFKSLAPMMYEWADAFGKATKRARVDVYGWLSSIQDLFVPMGFARDKAAELSKEVIKLTVDIASFNDVADTEVLLRIQSAMMGIHRSVRAYGIAITETVLDEELARIGKDKLTGKMLEQAKVQARLNLIIAGSKDAMGDAVNTATSWANMMKGLQAVILEVKTAIGEKLIPVLKPYVIWIEKQLMALRKWVEENKVTIIGLAHLAAVVVALGIGLTALGSIVTVAVLLPVKSIITTFGLASAALIGFRKEIGLTDERLEKWFDKIGEAQIGSLSIIEWLNQIKGAVRMTLLDIEIYLVEFGRMIERELGEGSVVLWWAKYAGNYSVTGSHRKAMKAATAPYTYSSSTREVKGLKDERTALRSALQESADYDVEYTSWRKWFRNVYSKKFHPEEKKEEEEAPDEPTTPGGKKITSRVPIRGIMGFFGYQNWRTQMGLAQQDVQRQQLTTLTAMDEKLSKIARHVLTGSTFGA